MRCCWTTVTLLEGAYGTGRWSRFCGSVSTRARASGTFSVNGQMGHHSPEWAWRKISSLHMPHNHGLYLPLSNATRHPIFQVGRSAWSRPQRCQLARDAAANWCQRFELRVWPRHKDCLLMTCRRTITPSSSIAPRMLRTLIVTKLLDFLKTTSHGVRCISGANGYCGVRDHVRRHA
jgi:hypothetical protein